METNILLLLVTIAAFAATIIGGLFAFRFRDRLHLILGFSSGAVIAVAFFDLMPESLELASAYEPSFVLSVMGLGFVTYLILDRLILLHGHDDDHAHGTRGAFGALSLSFHSFLDGIGIGVAFQISSSLGFIVAVAVLAHKFSDGINTVGMIVRSAGSRARAFLWLCINAIAPAFGVAASFLFFIPEQTFGLLLALFSGFFFYIGASDLLPESHHNHPVIWTTVATLLGIASMYAVIRLAGI